MPRQSLSGAGRIRDCCWRWWRPAAREIDTDIPEGHNSRRLSTVRSAG